MKAIFQKIKSFYALINRGILKVSDWMINGFRVALVFGLVLYAVGIGWFVLYADKVSLEDHTVLVMDLKGVLVEESPGGLKTSSLVSFKAMPPKPFDCAILS